MTDSVIQPSPQPPAMLFDLDGTLIDSVYQHVLAWQQALTAFELDLSVWKIHRRIGMSGGLLVTAPLSNTVGSVADLTPQPSPTLCTVGRDLAASSSRS